MTFPDTIPAWMGETPPVVPDCPPWCLEPAGHHDPTHVPGDWVRFHVAYQESFSTPAGDLLVELAAHEFWEGGVLAHEPAQLHVIRAERLSQADALRLHEMLGQAAAVLTRITGGRAMSTSRTRPEVARPAPVPGVVHVACRSPGRGGHRVVPHARGVLSAGAGRSWHPR